MEDSNDSGLAYRVSALTLAPGRQGLTLKVLGFSCRFMQQHAKTHTRMLSLYAWRQRAYSAGNPCQREPRPVGHHASACLRPCIYEARRTFKYGESRHQSFRHIYIYIDEIMSTQARRHAGTHARTHAQNRQNNVQDALRLETNGRR